MFVYENGNDKLFLRTEDFELTEIKDFGYNQSKFDLTFSVCAENLGYDISWEYCTDLYKEDRIKYLHVIFTTYLGNLLDNFEQPMGICKLLDEKEESKVLERIGKKPREIYTENILEVFEKNVLGNLIK